MDDFARLVHSVESHSSMKHALDWFMMQCPPLTDIDMVTQDEYSHDFVVTLPGGLWLVYDST